MFKDRLRSARKAKGLTQETLALAIGVKKSTVAGYESGNSEPDIDKIISIMKVLGVDANYLYQDEMSSEPSPSLSAEATEIAMDYDALPPDGKALVRAVLDFAATHRKAAETKPVALTSHNVPVRPDVEGVPFKRVGTDAMTGLPFYGGIGGDDEILNIKNIARIERREMQEELDRESSEETSSAETVTDNQNGSH